MLQKPFAAFDLEIAEEITDGANWLNRLPPIACAYVKPAGLEDRILWQGWPKMSPKECRQMVGDLMTIAQSHSLVTWNGAHFDFRVLAEQSGLWAECAQLALHHIDLMLIVVAVKGHYLGLNKALEGMAVEQKLKTVTLKDGSQTNISGAKAPELWKKGETEAVIQYLETDVSTTLVLAHRMNEHKQVSWISGSGKNQIARFPKLWTVQECLDQWRNNEPDTSWMTTPPNMETITSWIQKEARTCN